MKINDINFNNKDFKFETQKKNKSVKFKLNDQEKEDNNSPSSNNSSISLDNKDNNDNNKDNRNNALSKSTTFTSRLDDDFLNKVRKF